jgi:PAS domain S-box-containing protein
MNTINVLLVESDGSFARLLREELANEQSTPIRLVHCTQLNQALQYLSGQGRVDAVLLDLLMPDCHGLETFLRVQQQVPKAPIIILTGSDESLAMEAVRHGAQDYLAKDACTHRLLRRVILYSIERERAKEQLREREEFFRLISENVSDLIAVLDRDGRRLYNNASYKGLLGDPSAARGSNSFAEVHQDDRELIQRVFRETLATGIGQRVEYRFVLRDGGIRFVESQGNVIKEPSGKVSKVVLVSRDITERKQWEDALQQSERRYKQLLASMTDYIFTVTVEKGRSVKTTHGAGSLALTGYTPAEYGADPQLWFHVVHKDDRESVLGQIRRILRGETPPPLEHRLIHKDGGVRWIRNASLPYKDAQGRVVAYDGLISDITERKRAEDCLKQSFSDLAKSEETLRETVVDLKASHEELKATELELMQAAKMESIGTLAAGVAHEVKNPLQTMLQGLAYLANHIPAGNQNMLTTLNDMRDAVTRADTIIREFLQLSASPELRMQEEDLNAVIERSLLLMNYELASGQITVVRHLDAALPLVKLAAGKMEQVFLNLFINAVQAMSPGGTLTVSTRMMRWDGDLSAHHASPCHFQAGDHVVVAEVQDTGVGIPEENLPKIFEPFFTTKTAGLGSGLGLSVIQRIVDLHGGSIQIENAPRGGVKVTLILLGARPAR